MTPDTLNVPTARSWRDIAQPVKPRAMSRGGRWRRALALTRTVLLASFVLAACAGALWIAVPLTTHSRVLGVGAKSAMKPPELRTTRDGVLDSAWLERTLALPSHAALIDLDLEALRARVLADGQVVTANLTRAFPDRLVVSVTERVPVARVRVEAGGGARDFLVARDGVVFVGYGFDRALLDSLPWLDGVSLVPDGGGFKPIAGMGTAAQLLADAQFAAAHLYATWQILSLARLESDRVLEITTKDGSTITFGATGDYYLQLLRLDVIAERLEVLPGARARIDLSLGREAPVLIAPPGAESARHAKAPTAPAPPRSFFQPTPPKSQREL